MKYLDDFVKCLKENRDIFNITDDTEIDKFIMYCNNNIVDDISTPTKIFKRVCDIGLIYTILEEEDKSLFEGLNSEKFESYFSRFFDVANKSYYFLDNFETEHPGYYVYSCLTSCLELFNTILEQIVALDDEKFKYVIEEAHLIMGNIEAQNEKLLYSTLEKIDNVKSVNELFDIIINYVKKYSTLFFEHLDNDIIYEFNNVTVHILNNGSFYNKYDDSIILTRIVSLIKDINSFYEEASEEIDLINELYSCYEGYKSLYFESYNSEKIAILSK